MSTVDAQRLAAGLDEDKARAGNMHDELECRTYGPLPLPCDCGYPAHVLRDIAAKRAILALYEEFAAEQDRQLADPACKAVGPGVRTGTEVLGQVVAALAGVYAEANARG